jgi:hypothetical protein
MAILEKKWLFAASVVAHAPEENGIYALLHDNEVIYLGRALGGIRNALVRHLDGRAGACTQAATHYSWEISPWPSLRESEALAQFMAVNKRKPRCNAA